MSLIKNTAFTVPFVAVDKITGDEKTLLTGFAVTIAKDGGYANPITRPITEIGAGGYWIHLIADDTDCNIFVLTFEHPDAVIGKVTIVTDDPLNPANIQALATNILTLDFSGITSAPKYSLYNFAKLIGLWRDNGDAIFTLSADGTATDETGFGVVRNPDGEITKIS